MAARVSPNHDARPPGAEIMALVLHYTGMPTAEAAMRRLCDPGAKVSAHYLIDEDGRVDGLVPEVRRAWHAGRSAWRGRDGLNDVSIGIEIVNPGHEHGYRPFPDRQMAAVTALCADIVGRRRIAPAWVLAHSDIAPDRKEDPGEFFDWARLAKSGVGAWLPPPPEAPSTSIDVAEAPRLLRSIGYPLPQGEDGLRLALVAFQRRHLPECLDGRPTARTMAQLAAVAALLAPASSGRSPLATPASRA